jgi:GTP-binding protein
MARIIDEVTIFVKAGDGGGGCESRNYISEKKFIPTGGEGGRGGSVIMRSDPNVTTLKTFLYQRHFSAESGARGGSNHRKGKRGRDLTLSVPCGTMIFETGKHFLIRDLVRPLEEVVLLEGGKGGVGNEGGKEAQPGKPGGNLQITLSLRIPAEVFLVGLPNSGRSKLLNRLTHAHAKEETYPFSTKHPELGVHETPDFGQIPLCELPGIYRDSPEGRGVGFNFLKHLARAKMVVLILDPLNPFAASLQEGYEILREVLGRYEQSFLEIPQVVVVNKMDLAQVRERVGKENFRPAVPLFLISAETGEGVEPFMRYVVQEVRGRSDA